MCVHGSRILCKNGTKRSKSVNHVYRHHICTRLTRQHLRYRYHLSDSNLIHKTTYNLRKKPLTPVPAPFSPKASPQQPYLRQPQRILSGLLITRRLSHSIRHPTRGILDRASSALYGVADGIGCAFGSVTGGFAHAGDYEGLEEGWHGWVRWER